jgi:hypothetical protein
MLFFFSVSMVFVGTIFFGPQRASTSRSRKRGGSPYDRRLSARASVRKKKRRSSKRNMELRHASSDLTVLNKYIN